MGAASGGRDRRRRPTAAPEGTRWGGRAGERAPSSAAPERGGTETVPRRLLTPASARPATTNVHAPRSNARGSARAARSSREPDPLDRRGRDDRERGRSDDRSMRGRGAPSRCVAARRRAPMSPSAQRGAPARSTPAASRAHDRVRRSRSPSRLNAPRSSFARVQEDATSPADRPGSHGTPILWKESMRNNCARPRAPLR